jgi:predicted RNA binding protein YcfA (HicA-like mRNA interferase family)
MRIVNGKQIIKHMENIDWELERISGSHHIMAKPGQRAIPVPVHGKKDVPKGLACKILKQAGVKGVKP